LSFVRGIAFESGRPEVKQAKNVKKISLRQVEVWKNQF
jgi:hypothetical protein